ncbi:unnamed protein product [Paramecium octaurelia]|uniref:Uncharacterized protein n=1 Tax=Paramecium octaurelia TaxID=43137 RepID=A0A8S1VQW4_PAROT|nr:unnamed protein product [Paramecium octaurelia]
MILYHYLKVIIIELPKIKSLINLLESLTKSKSNIAKRQNSLIYYKVHRYFVEIWKVYQINYKKHIDGIQLYFKCIGRGRIPALGIFRRLITIT